MKCYCIYDQDSKKVLISKTRTKTEQTNREQATVKLCKEDLYQVISVLMDEIHDSTLDARAKEGKIQDLINNHYLELTFTNQARFNWLVRKINSF